MDRGYGDSVIEGGAVVTRTEGLMRFEDLVAVLAAEFDADVSVVSADVTAFLGELEREKMVGAVSAPPAR